MIEGRPSYARTRVCGVNCVTQCTLRAAIQTANARVVANLPYNIATAVLQRLIEQRRCLTELTLMLQREVVDRIISGANH